MNEQIMISLMMLANVFLSLIFIRKVAGFPIFIAFSYLSLKYFFYNYVSISWDSFHILLGLTYFIIILIAFEFLLKSRQSKLSKNYDVLSDEGINGK